MSETFREQVRRRLSGFSREDTCFFAWLCAVRALPFLGVKNRFDYWIHRNGDKRQTHLSAVLRAIDISADAADTYAARAARAARAAAYDAEPNTERPEPRPIIFPVK